MAEQSPREPALVTGDYDELNVFGRPTGRCTTLMKGEPLPSAVWVYVAARADHLRLLATVGTQVWPSLAPDPIDGVAGYWPRA